MGFRYLISVLTALYLSEPIVKHSEMSLRFMLIYRHDRGLSEYNKELQDGIISLSQRNNVLKKDIDYLSIGDSTFAKLSLEELEKLEGVLFSDEKIYWASRLNIFINKQKQNPDTSYVAHSSLGSKKTP